MGFQFYYDEAELGNPLGSKKGKNKMGFVYFTLMNLPPTQRSSLNAIYLLAVGKSEIFKKHGPLVCLRNLIEKLKEFENGAPITVNSKQSIWFGANLNFVGYASIKFFGGLERAYYWH